MINSLIQQCQKCQKWGFEAKERESSPRSHTLLFGDFSQGEGECGDGKRISKLENLEISEFVGGI